jgi:phosphoglycerate kinase
MTKPFKTLDDMGDVQGKRVLVREDLNVPMAEGHVTDDTRLRATVATVGELADKGAIVLVLAHFGRPKGVPSPEFSLSQVVKPYSEVLGREVRYIDWEGADDAVATLDPGDIAVLENTRFFGGEETNDAAVVQRFASLGDLYVNDAFSAAHRAHASTEGLAHVLPAFAGRAMEAELDALQKALGEPEHPVAAVAARGVDVGKSLCEHELASVCEQIMEAADKANCTVHLPYDVVVAKEFKPNPATRTVNVHEVAADEMILDVGPAAVESLGDVLKNCRTLVWNGPLGAFETVPFDKATVALAKTAAALTEGGSLVSVAGGGDTVAALNHAGVAEAFTFVSTAGGAFLEWMEGKDLPGVAALTR